MILEPVIHGIDLTRMECKVSNNTTDIKNEVCIDLTRMECKVYMTF